MSIELRCVCCGRRDLGYGVICMPCAVEVVGIANRTTL